MISILIDFGYRPQPKPLPAPASPPPPPAAPTEGDLYRLVPEDGWNHAILSALWARREESVGLWRLVNRLAEGFHPRDWRHKRLVKRSIYQDLEKLLHTGWVIRRAGKIQLNCARLECLCRR